MIEGSTSFNFETVCMHEKSQAHKIATDIHRNTVLKPENALGRISEIMLTIEAFKTVSTKCGNVHACVYIVIYICTQKKGIT